MIKITPRDHQVLAALRRSEPSVTYVVRNWLSDFGRGPNLTTPQVLRSLKRLEKAGLVERCPTPYVVMIRWRLTRKGAA